uniref:Uncharacterized protein n=1 Tax=Rhizophora mucronata TaxID=61149 RepID=A0A2P2QAS5_RHIMU
MEKRNERIRCSVLKIPRIVPWNVCLSSDITCFSKKKEKFGC